MGVFDLSPFTFLSNAFALQSTALKNLKYFLGNVEIRTRLGSVNAPSVFTFIFYVFNICCCSDDQLAQLVAGTFIFNKIFLVIAILINFHKFHLH